MKELFSSLWNSQTAVVRLMRGALLGGGMGIAGGGEADPTTPVGQFNWIAALLGAFAGLLGAGEPNPT